ncbi:DUF1800 domain-containing protein [Variovorax sp. RA8]|uniref:DUF1800 domain-containing protein n=1 Tax=Variovorax sp. (strain JCM 16519 / RA8) TaxID=662548 RepID=UPI001316AC49|nr:DUF1800 family protein [Variovorax sp. RA8]VTU37629.1 hypothetical protein RA8CHR_05773 [Variovorax sp. RA8]
MVEDLATDRAGAIDEPLRAPEAFAESSPAATTGLRNPLPLSAALAAAAALAACGGGGGGGGGGGFAGLGIGNNGGSSGDTVQAGTLTPLASTPSAQTYVYSQAKTDDEAARFLLQAQFSASEAEIAAVRAQGYLPWLGEQMDRAPTQTGWAWIASKPHGAVNTDDMIWNQLMTSADGVRKRLALALSEIFVVSANDISSNWTAYMFAQYWDMLVAGVTGNFRQLLENVTLNPAMGYYLNTKGNQKENAQGRQPDENYAREVMQLMSIGLYQLNADGSVKAGADGTPLETYAQDDVTSLARVFTGYDLDIPAAERNAFTPPGESYTIESNAWTQRPMALTASRHSMLEARFLGTTVPANTEGKAALKIALDTLFNHSNVGPFIGRQLIQRLVTSNPSAAYVKRVSDVFADNGAGVRGDMKSVFAAVLLDNEARSPAGLADPNFGHLREPMLRLVQWGRTFGAGSAAGTWKIGNRSDAASSLGQSPLRSPSVFNFFRPGYVPPSSAMADAKLVAPEFQLVNETSVGGYLNFMQNVVPNGFNGRDVIASYAAEKALVLDPAALVRRLNLLMAANQLDAGTVELITNALATPAVTATSSDTLKNNRVYAAVLMVMAAPGYLVQK